MGFNGDSPYGALAGHGVMVDGLAKNTGINKGVPARLAPSVEMTYIDPRVNIGS